MFSFELQWIIVKGENSAGRRRPSHPFPRVLLSYNKSRFITMGEMHDFVKRKTNDNFSI